MEGREASVCEDRRKAGGVGEVVEEDGEVVTAALVEGGEVTEERRELLEFEFCEALVVVVVFVSLRALTVALEGIVVVVVAAMSD